MIFLILFVGLQIWRSQDYTHSTINYEFLQLNEVEFFFRSGPLWSHWLEFFWCSFHVYVCVFSNQKQNPWKCWYIRTHVIISNHLDSYINVALLFSQFMFMWIYVFHMRFEENLSWRDNQSIFHFLDKVSLNSSKNEIHFILYEWFWNLICSVTRVKNR